MYEQQYNPYAANIKIVKDYFKSGKVLTLAILNVISAVFTFVCVSVFIELLYGQYYMVLKELGLPRSFESSIRSLAYAYASFAAIWFVLMAVGFFIIFAKSRNSLPDVTPRAGFNILKVVAVFQLIGAIIATIFWVIIAIICLAGASSISYLVRDYIPGIYDSSTLQFIMIVLAFAFLVYAFFLMFEAINRIRFLNSAKKSMNSVELYSSGSGAYGVVNVILAVFSGISLIATILSFNIFSLISGIISLLIFIFTAALALGYNKYIQRQKQSYQTNAPYGGGQNNYGAPAAQTPYASAPSAPAYSNNPDPYAGTPNPYAAPNPYANTPNPNANTPETTPAASTPEPVSAAPDPAASTPEPVSAAPEQQNAGKVCSSCGSPVGENDPFCGNCGSKL